ncbi:MAG: SprT family zinc-dependent metalloprotease [Pseudomonadota bacterium]
MLLLKPKPNIDLPDYIVIKHSTRAKRLALRLDAQKRVFNLVIPKRVSIKAAVRFAEEHDSWMMEKLAELPAPIPYEDGMILPLFGEDVRVKIFYDSTLKITSITLKKNELSVSTNKEDPTSRIERYLKKIVKEELTKLSRDKAAQIDKTINTISIRDTKSRWGSCSEDNNLSYSWRLIFAPTAAFDYVVAHEVAHLQHLDHSRAFWALCRELSDDFVEGQYWMQEHGHELMRYGA